MHPVATTGAPVSAAASSVSIESCFAFSTKPHVLTSTTSASDPSVVTCQPPAASRAASSSESTSLRAQPRVSNATRRAVPSLPDPVATGTTAVAGEVGTSVGTSRGYPAGTPYPHGTVRLPTVTFPTGMPAAAPSAPVTGECGARRRSVHRRAAERVENVGELVRLDQHVARFRAFGRPDDAARLHQ